MRTSNNSDVLIFAYIIRYGLLIEEIAKLVSLLLVAFSEKF